jgi:hypothetical protein
MRFLELGRITRKEVCSSVGTIFCSTLIGSVLALEQLHNWLEILDADGSEGTYLGSCQADGPYL